VSQADLARAKARGVLRVYLFGTPRLEYGERRVSLGSRPRIVTLFALLLMRRGRPIGRDDAAFALWPDAAESAARAELRRYLNVLDSALEAAGAASPIVREGRTLRIDLAAPVWVDALAFEDANDGRLEAAVSTYGTFLSGFDDEWIVAERERLQALFLQTLDRLADRARTAGEHSAALRWTSALQRADPLREETVRSLMRTHLALGDRAAALAAFRDFRVLLKRELDVDPMPSTVALHDEIAAPPVDTRASAGAAEEASDHAIRRAMLAHAQVGDRARALRKYAEFERGLGELGARPEPATESLAASLRDLSTIVPPWTARDLLPNNLPVFVTPLVGREHDLDAIAALLRESRLVTVLGGAGLGKTRAACAVAENVLRERHDGAFFADLSDVARDDAVAARLARATRTRVVAGRDPIEALTEDLRDRHLLLVVDNCEHVLAGATRGIDVLLRGCPRLAILATSRALLFLEGERAYDLAPLPIPAGGSSPTYAEALAIPSVALFAARYATSERRGREVQARLADALAICRHADGVPLALELAACAGRHDDLRVLLASLRSGGGRREAASSDGRWKTLADALEWSVRLLEEPHRALLERVSVFAGTFSLGGAAAVADDAQNEVARGLAALCDKSLLVAESVDPPAYRFLAPMREHARERLHAGAESGAVRVRYAQYFVDRAHRFESDFGRLPTIDWVARYAAAAADLESVLELALDGAIDAHAAFRLLPAMRGYWYATDPMRGLQWLQRFEERVMRDGSPVDRGRFLSTRGGLLGALGNASEALGVAEKAVALLAASDEPRALGIALRDLGDALGILGDERAGEVYSQAAEIFRAVDDRARLASTLTQSGIYAYNRGDADEARRYYDEARLLSEDIAELRSFASATTGLGELEFSLGNAERAIELASAAIGAFRELRSDVGLWVTLANRSGYHIALGNLTEARSDLYAALEPLERTGSRTWLALAMQQAAAIASASDATIASTLLGFSASRADALEIHREPVGERQYRELIDRLDLDNEGSALRAHFERGAELSDAEALALARRAARDQIAAR
jgi:predicted ATPase/DNA-binding SARP family transcriptional activator